MEIPALMLISNTEGMGIALQHMAIEPIRWTESDPSAPTDLTEMIFGAERKRTAEPGSKRCSATNTVGHWNE